MTLKQTVLLALTALVFCSCASSRKLVYFNEIKDTTFLGIRPVEEIRIVPNDILSISISSLSPEASALFNPDATMLTRATTITGANTERGGYLVDPEGFVQLPVLGKIKAAGLTKDQLKDAITQPILEKKLLKDPLVEIRFLNYEVTVLGEVGKPTVITVPSEKISLLKAIGLAGDLTIHGKRNNILLIREEDGNRITHRVDLTQPDFLTSPYYYLQPNDVVYVQPNKAKGAQATLWPQLVPILLTALSVTVIVLDRMFR